MFICSVLATIPTPTDSLYMLSGDAVWQAAENALAKPQMSETLYPATNLLKIDSRPGKASSTKSNQVQKLGFSELPCGMRDLVNFHLEHPWT